MSKGSDIVLITEQITLMGNVTHASGEPRESKSQSYSTRREMSYSSVKSCQSLLVSLAKWAPSVQTEAKGKDTGTSSGSHLASS